MWLRTTTFGDDKDRVVVRSNGEPTYLAADIAYLAEQARARVRAPADPGRVPTTTPTCARLKAAMAALGGDPDTLEVPIIQFVHLVEGGERAAMSKRRGEFVTLDELLDEIGVDATRFFMLQRSHDRTIDLDLELAREQSRGEPGLLRPVRPRPDRVDAAAGCRTSAWRGALTRDWGAVALAARPSAT